MVSHTSSASGLVFGVGNGNTSILKVVPSLHPAVLDTTAWMVCGFNIFVYAEGSVIGVPAFNAARLS